MRKLRKKTCREVPQSSKMLLAIVSITIFFMFLQGVSAFLGSLDTGHVAYYEMQQTSGNETDLKFFDNNITSFQGNVQRGVPGLIDNAYNFSGSTGDYVETELISEFNSTNGSISIWFNWTNDDNNAQFVMGFYDLGVDRLEFNIDSRVGFDNMTVTAKTGGVVQWSIDRAGLPSLNVWNHLVLVHNGTGLDFYLNNVKQTIFYSVSVDKTAWVQEVMNTGATLLSFGALREGGGAGGAYGGLLDEIGIWNRTLTVDEINQLFNGGNGLQFTEFTNLNSPVNLATTISRPVIFNATLAPSSTFNLTNATLNIWNADGSLLVNITNIVTGTSSNDTIFNFNLTEGIFAWNVFGCQENGTVVSCAFAGLSNNTLFWGVENPNTSLVSSVFETDSQVFNVTFNSSQTPTGSLFWDGIRFTTTATNIFGNQWRLSRTMDIPLTNAGSKNVFWEIISGALGFNTTTQTQTVSDINLSLCGGAGGTIPYINFTFKNETTNQEEINASVPSSTFRYWLGSGVVNRTFSFSNSSENREYQFCFTPPDKTVNTEVLFSYDNSESQQRTFNPATLSLSNTTDERLLFLLPTSEGIFVTFQIISVSGQPIQGALVTLIRSGFGTIASATTGGSGTANIFLNPDAQYTLTVSKVGFTTFITTQAFPTSEFTITLGGGGITTEDLTKGISFDINPKFKVLENNTIYNFNMTLNSSFWAVSQYGFVLLNGTGTVLGSVSTSTLNELISVNLDTANESLIIMNYFWIINNTYSNSTTLWTVFTPGEGSIKGFFDRLKLYLPEEPFGLNNFGLMIILFIIVFTTTGILSLKFGITSAPSIMFVIFALVALFDVGLGLIPNPVGERIVGLPTLFAFLIFISLIIREVTK